MTATHTATETEFEQLGYLQIVIMHVLWNLQHKPELCTVKHVADDVNERRTAAGQQPLAYTTFLTVMRNLARRKFVAQASTNGRAHTFVPLVTKEKYEREVVCFIRDTVFEGDAKRFAATLDAP